jgi:hypothetical protein
MRINREEIFGPVASVIRVKDYDVALALANDTDFGLTAGICTTSLKHASHYKRNVEAGMVMVNLPTAGVDYHAPFERLILRTTRTGPLCRGVLSSHKGPKAREMIEAAGSTLLFLSPYSPDFNPIENGSVANRSFGRNEMVSRR